MYDFSELELLKIRELFSEIESGFSFTHGRKKQRKFFLIFFHFIQNFFLKLFTRRYYSLVTDEKIYPSIDGGKAKYKLQESIVRCLDFSLSVTEKQPYIESIIYTIGQQIRDSALFFYRKNVKGFRKHAIDEEDLINYCFTVLITRLLKGNQGLEPLAVTENPKSFISNFVSSRAVEILRKKGLDIAEQSEDENQIESIASRDNVENSIIREEQYERLKAELHRFKPIQKVIFTKRFFENSKPKRIAADLHIDINKVYYYINYSKIVLKESLAS